MSELIATADARCGLVRVPLSCTHTPAQALCALRGARGLFALVGEWAGSAAIIGSEPLHMASAEDDPFEVLDRLPAVDEQADEACDAVGGGWFGYLGYALAHNVEALNAPPASQQLLPAFQLAFYDHLLRRDARGQWWFEALASERRARALDKRLHQLRRIMAAPAPAPVPYTFAPWQLTPSDGAHAEAVAACRERIRQGDLYQANLSLRLHSRLDGDPLDVFCAGATHLRPERGAFIATSSGAIASFSPELYLSRRGEMVSSAPIKGTSASSPDVRVAGPRVRQLERSPKERTENVMIVDLVRNDLGRVCEYGSVTVSALARAREQAGVINLVSQVEGRLRPGTSHAQLLRATFPPGSVTGAPKLAALNVIAELESTRRELYTGAIGFASPLAGLELNVAIRTLESCDQATWLGVGGGIVSDSLPAVEVEEVKIKARPLLDAVGGVLADQQSVRPLGRPRRLGPSPLPRPESARGVFETMLVTGGRAPRLGAHLARLAASARELYGSALEQPIAEEVASVVRGLARGRARLTAIPRHDGLEIGIELGELELGHDDLLPIDIALVTLPGGLGAHKWRDRRLIDAVTASAGCLPVFVDLDGYLLEASRANIFLVRGASVLTPPLDGRILPGTTRARTIARACQLGCGVAERPIHQSELASADGIFLTSSLRGIEPVLAVDGRAADFACSELGAGLADGLCGRSRQEDGTPGSPGSGAPSLETSGAS
ncbi:MAG TPA: aminodeoxychorismate synthase component I [Solirubrobacteraceae bacterium]|nr:aminodeoxychorismate synthase component I [Solirubrobacteraceae bacterium]